MKSFSQFFSEGFFDDEIDNEFLKRAIDFRKVARIRFRNSIV